MRLRPEQGDTAVRRAVTARRTAVVISLVVMASGCATSGRSRWAAATAGVGATSVTVGAVMALNAGSWSEECQDSGGNGCPFHVGMEWGPAATAFGYVGLALLGTGILLAATSREPAPQPLPNDEAYYRQRSRNRNDAAMLMQRAATAARTFDCATVHELASDVRDLDANFHATVFMRDVAISWCYTPNRDRAVALLKSAVTAARSGDCATTLALQVQIRSLDLDVHDVWFVTDPAVKTCLPPSATLLK